MKYIEDEKLTKLTSELADATLGRSRSIHGRIEAYIMGRTRSDKKYAYALGERYVAEMENIENQLADYKSFMERHSRLFTPEPLSQRQPQQQQQQQQPQEPASSTTEAATTPTTSSSPADSATTAGGRKRSMSTGSHLEATTSANKHAKKNQRPRSSSFDETASMTKKTVGSAAVASGGFGGVPSAFQQKSPLGDFGEMGTRRLMTDLILTLNASFPDYDFGSVRPSDFEKIPVSTVVQRINERLSELAVDKMSFITDMWTALDDVVRLADCDVYSYAPKARDEDDDPLSFLTQTLMDSVDQQSTEESSTSMSSTGTSKGTVLWTFNYFFVNKSLKRIVFFTCIECMRSEGSIHSQHEDDEVSYVRFRSEEASDVDFDLDPSADVAGGIPIPIV